VRVPLWQRPSLHLQRSMQVAQPPAWLLATLQRLVQVARPLAPRLRLWFQPAARAIRAGCRRQVLQHMLQQAPEPARLSGLSMWQSWCATVGQIVGSSAPPRDDLASFRPGHQGPRILGAGLLAAAWRRTSPSCRSWCAERLITREAPANARRARKKRVAIVS